MEPRRTRPSWAGCDPFMLHLLRWPRRNVVLSPSGRRRLWRQEAAAPAWATPSTLAAAGSIGRQALVASADASQRLCSHRATLQGAGAIRWMRSLGGSTRAECVLPEAPAGTSHWWPICFPERRVSLKPAKASLSAFIDWNLERGVPRRFSM
jgi:hypothetical protein